MEQVDGGDLIVNRGNEAKIKNDRDEKKYMNLVEGLETAKKLAKASWSFTQLAALLISFRRPSTIL
jgi:hypothetical protein